VWFGNQIDFCNYLDFYHTLMWCGATSPQSGIKSSLSIPLIFATCRRIPTSASINQGNSKDFLIREWPPVVSAPAGPGVAWHRQPSIKSPFSVTLICTTS
jgi:hypothetical protein